MTRSGVLLVGLGQIGMGYDLHLDSREAVYTHARALSRHPRFDLIAGVDPDAERCQLFEKTYGCPAYRDVDSALVRHAAAVVTIACPTQFHGAVLRQVLGRGTPRVILCEKPLSQDVNDAEAMAQSCAERGVTLYVNYTRRSDPGVIEIKKRLDSGQMGTPAKGVAWYSKGFLHNGSHLFNLAEYWLGPMENAEVLDPGRLWNDIDPEPDVRVTFSRGTIVFLAAREEAFSHHTVELLAPNGRLRYDRRGEIIEWQPARPYPHFPGYTALSSDTEPIASGRGRYQWHVVEQLAAAIDGRDFHLCSGVEALTTLRSMRRIIENR